MALVVFLRGVNVGGHRTFKPAALVKQLAHLDAVNIGAAGTFVIRKRVSRAKVRAELARRLPFETHMMICEGRDITKLVSRDPFSRETARPDVVRFISVLSRVPREFPTLPVHLPPSGQWLLQVLARDGQFVVGQYRRHMKTIGYLGTLDRVLGTPVTTRNWNTIGAIIKILNGDSAR
jgi:uncharacterized protein (DUF1697 family)